MSKSTKQLPATTTSTEVAAPIDNMFAADAGAGMEGATQDSFAIPFITVLQKGSPQVDDASGAAIPGAKAGMFFDTVNGRLFDGKKGITIVPCYYRRVFLRWAPKGQDGAGFKGELSVDQVTQLRASGKIVELDGKLYVPLPDGTINEKRCDRIADTRNHYVLLLDEETGGWTEALMSLTSTQIKKSKLLMTSLASIKVNGQNGLFTPPTFASRVRVTTTPESNDKGAWWGVKFEVIGRVEQSHIYAAAKAFHHSIAKGAIDVKYEDHDIGAQHAESDGF
jgi:hypothetical protein